jgi:hypothetical protein
MAYKFQSGDATLSGSVTLVGYQDLLFETDAISNIGTAAKAAGIVYADRLTASVGVSGSAIYADNFYGNGSGITGLSSDSATVTGSNQNVDLQLVLVQAAGTGETLAVDNAGAIAFNPSTNLLSSTGAIVAGTTLSASTSVAGKSILLGQNGLIGPVGDTDLLKLATNQVTVAGALSASSTLNIVGASNFGPANNLTISAAGVLSSSAKLQSDVGVEFAKNKFAVDTAGAVTLTGVASESMSVASGTMAFVDAANVLKKTTWAASIAAAVGGVTDTAMASAGNGTFNLDIANLNAEDIATGDSFVFNDAGDNGLHKETVDDVMKIGMSLLSEAPISLANDFLVYSDANDSNFGKRIKMKSFIAAAADGTTITSSNGVLSVVGAQNIDVDTLGNASFQLTSAGMNYATASITTNVTYTLPASPATGDIVYIKLAAVNSGKHAVISGSGMQLIDGATAITASSPFAGISLCYVASDVWRVF